MKENRTISRHIGVQNRGIKRSIQSSSFGHKGKSLTSVCRLARISPTKRTLHLFRRYLFPAATRVTLLALLAPLLHFSPLSPSITLTVLFSPLDVPAHQFAPFRTLFFVSRRLRLPPKRVRGRPTSAVIRLISSSSQGMS